ncbi:hydroxyacid dehydrogenase [candidate division KD3-62 bacterium DG_56]|uniref:Hydroxyacid dehydrogenase n=1 Tax=candidate division KD3-62 bacterium DG_56 TaxID=1704032 RepID=A0A0S7XRN9_9BACT|nr:MAG: hydroxyacid dehydrogenase [candidate division KD3-62 bacterium DG_56]
MANAPSVSNVVFFEVHDWERDYLSHAPVGDSAVRTFEEPLDHNAVQLAAGAAAVSVFIYSDVSREVVEQLPDVRLIATRSTGYDHIDMAAARERGIVVCNVPDYGANTVAEHAFGLILGLSRRIFAAYGKVKQRDFSLDQLRGFDLKGKTIGVVGAGSIGLHVIRIARGVGMEALAYDVREQPLIAEVLGFRYVDLDTLLEQSDVISLHAPLVPQTHHLINRETLRKVKPGVLIINTARGELVDIEALTEALDEGWVGGAGLDVFEGEHEIKEESELLRRRERPKDLDAIIHLLDRDDVILTSHMAFYSEEALSRILDTTLGNIRAFMAGEPQNIVSG